MADLVSTRRSIFVSSRILIARHPLAAYFTIAFLGTWLVDLPIVLGQDGLGLMGYQFPLAPYLILFILSFFAGPTLGAILVTGALEGKPGVRAFFRRYVQWRIHPRWYLLALLGVPLIYFISAAIWLGADILRELGTNWMAVLTVYLPAVLLFPAMLTWGEEPGWRGFALTQMQLRYHPIIASLAVGFFNGIWRLPVFLIANKPLGLGPFHPASFAINVAAIMMVSIIWTWVFNNASGSILMAVLLHAAFNASQIWIVDVAPNFPVAAGYTSLGIFLVIAVNIGMSQANLGYRPNRQDRGGVGGP